MSIPQPMGSTDTSPVPVSGDYPNWVVSKTPGLHIRESASKNSGAVGLLDLGQSLPAGEAAERGTPYPDCGGGEWWIPVLYLNRRCYVILACVEWNRAPGSITPGIDPADV
jgi:hypothetical protein